MVKVKLISDKEYAPYGRVLTRHFDVSKLVEMLQEMEAPEDDVVYVPSVESFESLPVVTQIADSLFGGLPLQAGYCNGTNYKLNAVEYHRSSEIGVAASDLILLLGKQQDILEDFTYDSSKIEAFFVPKGTVYEMYATTLHYAPCSAGSNPFRNVVILHKGTNTDIVNKSNVQPEDKLMTAKNKWLIAHEEAGIENAFVGIKGENITV